MKKWSVSWPDPPDIRISPAPYLQMTYRGRLWSFEICIINVDILLPRVYIYITLENQIYLLSSWHLNDDCYCYEGIILKVVLLLLTYVTKYYNYLPRNNISTKILL